MLFRKSNLWNNATVWNPTWMLSHCLSLNRCRPCHCQPVLGELAINHISSHSQISPHHCCHLIVFIKTKWWHKKNGEKTMHVWNVSVLSLNVSINVSFPSKPEINHLLPQAKFSPVTAASCLCLLKKSRNTKENGEKPLHIFYFIVLLLTIFSIKLLFSGPSPRSIISLPTGQI